MSTLLSVKSLSFDTNLATLFSNITFTIQAGDRIGLIGHNGSGKSTLLKLLNGVLSPHQGTVHYADQCVMAYIEQYLPESIASLTLIEALLEKLPQSERLSESWRAEVLLSQLGFTTSEWTQTAYTLSGGQHTHLLLGRALIINPDLLLLDEPSNHLDLPTLYWLTQFLKNWAGSFVLVSHDQTLLDAVTNCTWILRDQTLHFYRLPCSKAREELVMQDLSDEYRHNAEQKEIDRITTSAKRLAIWGKSTITRVLPVKQKRWSAKWLN